MVTTAKADKKEKKELDIFGEIYIPKNHKLTPRVKSLSAWFMSQMEIYNIICICSLDRYGKWISWMKGKCHKASGGR